MLVNLTDMTTSMQLADGYLATMTKHIEIMNGQMSSMTNMLGSMTSATHRITQGVSGLNQSIGRPMSFMNSFAPW